ncbi:MAG TPA: hypothetical protein VLB84_11705, partial [Bacteroidia bacterium]|nr:hypothetical protein [Bacteroidia bacterium]
PATDGVNVTPETKQQIETFEQVYAQEIADAERAPTEKEQEEKKLKAANNYVNSITLVVNSKKSDLKEQPDPEKQKELNQDIAVMEKNIAAKQKVADDSKGKIAVITKTPVTKDQLPGDVATKQTATDKVGNQLKEETATPVKNIVDTKQPFTYSTTSAKSNLVKASALNKEADDLFAESKRVKEQAALQNDVTEKNALYAKAEELSKSAETKKVEAAQAVGTANATEYRNNQHAIDQYINANTGSADELAIADLMKDEAKMYFDKAQNSRKAAASFETYYAKETALEDADKNEQIALQKQNSALAIYKKNNPKFVVKPLAVTDIAAKTVAKDKETSKPPAGDDKTLALNKTAVKPEASTNKEKTTAADKPVATDKQDVTTEKTTTNNLNAADKSLTTESPVKPVTTETRVKPITTETAKPVITEPSTTDKSVPSNIKEVSKQKDTEDKTDTAVPVTPDQSVKNNVVKTDQSLADNETKKTINLPVKENEKENTKDTGTKITDRPSGTANDLERPITVVKPAENTKAKTKFSFKELFEKRGRSKYSDANPIPMDEKLPDGLIFKVQMGAFKNPIPQDLFKGITPVTGQTTSQGFIRYSAGLFLTCESAEKAKVEIRELGFPDAFVVAYFDGKRIPSPCGADGTTIAATTKPTEEVIVQKTETISPPVITSPVVKTKPETGIA